MSDQAAREAALQTDRHLLLQAPAGSGKTTVLAQRFLAALAGVEEPEEVLAITFTRKAAGEMRERVLHALEDRLGAGQPDLARWQSLRTGVLAQAQRRGWRLEELPARLRIQTIDSLCHEIARAMPLLGRMQQQLDVVDDAREAYAEAAAETLRQAESDPAYQADADLLLRRLDNDWERAVLLLAGLLGSRNRWQPVLLETTPQQLGQRVAGSLLRLAGEAASDLHSAIPPQLLAEAQVLLAHSMAHRDADPPRVVGLSPDAASLPAWRALAELLLRDDGQWRAQVNVRQGFPPQDKAMKLRWRDWSLAMQALPDLPRRLHRAETLPPAHIDAAESAALAALARLLLLCAMQLKLVFRERGQVDHSEVSAVARQALRDMDTPTELSVRQTLRVRHLLVDEFQDTSPEQIHLVRELVQGWDDDLVRSLFLVGDPMQSIYLFRDSEVGLFLQTRATGVGTIQVEALQLRRNFRSVPSLVDWSNAAFVGIFPRTEDVRSSAVTFLAAEAVRGVDQEGEAVSIWPQRDAGPEREAEQIAAEIARLRQRHPQWRIAVLVQTRPLAPPILAALQRTGVPVLGVDLAPLSERPVVRDLIALGQALLDAADRSAWLSVLHAPACGLTLEDLHALIPGDADAPLLDVLAEPARWTGLSADGQRRLERVAPMLLRGWQGRGERGLADGIESLWRQLGGWEACHDEERGAALQYLAALRRLAEREVIASPGRLRTLAAGLRDRGGAVAENPVELLTIHHAKGLEWDAVFLPGLGRTPRGDDSPLLRWLELPATSGQTDLLLAVRSLGEASASDPLGRFIAGLQRERQDNERVRLAYVAVTRARQRLYLSGFAPWSEKAGRAVPRSRSLLHILWPAVHQAFDDLPPPMTPGQETPARLNLAAPWYRLPGDFRLPVRRAGLPGGAPASTDAGLVPEYDWVGPLARAAGTLIHAELERFLLQGVPDAPSLDASLESHVARLRELGIDEATARRAAGDIVARLHRLREDPRARWLLATPHRESRSEWRLSGVVDGVLRNVVIDRSFVDAEGCRWIVDYKTSSHAGGGLERFLESELARYRPQLETYAELAGRMGPEPVRMALYFPWLGEFRELVRE